MKVINVKGNKYIDQELFNYINQIWINYDIEIANDSNIYFLKNTTVNRLITDYCEKGILRVIKKEKADYLVINRFALSNYPMYYNPTANSICDDDTQEVVYTLNGLTSECHDTIDQILEFISLGIDIKYVNQDRLNESLNNGFVITKDNYTQVKELVDSQSSDNHELAVKMLINSDLKSNWKWILYIFHKKSDYINSYDSKKVIINYLNSLGLTTTHFNNIDSCLSVIKDNEDVKERVINIVKCNFNKEIKKYFETIGTHKFKLNDFNIEYQE